MIKRKQIRPGILEIFLRKEIQSTEASVYICGLDCYQDIMCVFMLECLVRRGRFASGN